MNGHRIAGSVEAEYPASVQVGEVTATRITRTFSPAYVSPKGVSSPAKGIHAGGVLRGRSGLSGKRVLPGTIRPGSREERVAGFSHKTVRN